MDARSSMDNIRGYRAVIEAANEYGGFFTGQITAAGRINPATVLIVGAGVAGLAALGAARGLGAIVKAFDVRPAVKDQVESLGGEFLEVSIDESGDGGGGYAKTMSAEYHTAQMDLFFEQAKDVDIVITTALIPGRDAPILWEARAVEAMKPGSVVVDIAAPRGGNCELTKAGEVYTHTNDVKIIGYEDLPSRMSTVASQLYGTNLCHLLKDMTDGGKGEYRIDLEDEVVRGAILLHEGTELPRTETGTLTGQGRSAKAKGRSEARARYGGHAGSSGRQTSGFLTSNRFHRHRPTRAMGLFEFCLHTAR